MSVPRNQTWTLRESELDTLVAELCHPGSRLADLPGDTCKPMPSRQEIVSLIELLRTLFFPRCYGPENLDEHGLPYHIGLTLDRVYYSLREQIHRGLCFSCDGEKKTCSHCAEEAARKSSDFMDRLPEIARLLHSDVRATFEGDPAATSLDEIIFAYPGITAMLCHRVAHEIYKLDVKIIARIMSEYAHSQTGIDIHPGATIDERFMIDHGTGVVIGETTEIGKGVRLYQGVTLGAKSFPTDAAGQMIRGAKRHPTLQDEVVVYAGATILGTITIGHGSVIGGNVWLTESTPPGTRVLQNRAMREAYEWGGGI